MSKTIIEFIDDPSLSRIGFSLFKQEGRNIPGGEFVFMNADDLATNPHIQSYAENQLENDALRQTGHFLYQTLTSENGVSIALQNALSSPAEPFPIYLLFRGGEAEAFPWETMFADGANFLSLDPRWPIARMVVSGVERRRFTIVPPLKILLILAAAGVDATPEWEAIARALDTLDLPYQVDVYVSDTLLKEQIEMAGVAEIKAHFVPGHTDDLIDKIKDAAPDIIHFFCHGSNEGTPHLQIATRLDWETGSDIGRVTLERSQFEAAEILKFTWLITLNCCLGAAAAQNTHSLARSLVTAGFPAVVGMRESIDATDASIFSFPYYRRIFERLNELTADEAVVEHEIEWAFELQTPRLRLIERHGTGPVGSAAGRHRSWTLPIIYVNEEPLILIKGDLETIKLLDERNNLLALRDTLINLPGALAEVDERITAINQQLGIN